MVSYFKFVCLPMPIFSSLNLPGTPNTSKRVLHGVRAQKVVPKISKQKYYNLGSVFYIGREF